MDSLRVAKRPPETVGARPLAVPRARQLAFLVAAHRAGVLDDLIEEAAKIEDEWRRSFPGGIVDGGNKKM